MIKAYLTLILGCLIASGAAGMAFGNFPEIYALGALIFGAAIIFISLFMVVSA